ncbi:diaminopimelate epimerase [bacterium]|nr:diaminopimelate epimerase [bacterium]
MNLSFEKWEAAGNTFLVLRAESLSEKDRADWVVQATDQRLGIPADGVLFGRRIGASVLRVRIYNKDGKEAEISLNGLRVAAAFSMSRGQTIKEVHPVDGMRWDLESFHKTLDGGDVSISRSWRGLPSPQQVNTGIGVGWRVRGVGNPHLVIPGEHLPMGAYFRQWGSRLALHSAFPSGTNVHFVVREKEGEIQMRTWERGVGPTPSCGSGALAVATWARAQEGGQTWRCRSPGGCLTVVFGEDRAICSGPVRRLLSGEMRTEKEGRVD